MQQKNGNFIWGRAFFPRGVFSFVNISYGFWGLYFIGNQKGELVRSDKLGIEGKKNFVEILYKLHGENGVIEIDSSLSLSLVGKLDMDNLRAVIFC